MYGHFVQFTFPKIGQGFVAAVLYLNFLQLPFVACFADTMPLVYLLLPLALLGVVSWLGSDPLGPGMILNAYLMGFYLAGDLITLLTGLAGGRAAGLWQRLWLGGLPVWVLTALMLLWGYRRAMRLCTTTYRLRTCKPLPGGHLRILQISDLHPGRGAMDRTRIPELERRIALLQPDLIVMTGDIYDEYVTREDFDAFNAFFARLKAPGGKWFVYGNHDLFHHWREPSFGRADLERGFAAAGVRILEDTSVLLPCGVRVVGRKDYLYTNGSRFTAAQLMPSGPDDHYTVWLDHEPRDFKNAAAAGADLILSGHTHGGQVWPAGAVGMVAKNERNYGRKHIADHCDAIVSGGTGTWGYKFRTQGRTEIVCAEITTEREN